jgi:PAS domain S-box-containing protein
MSIAALIAAVLLRWLLDPVMGNSLQVVTMFGAVAVAIWIAGYQAACLVAVVGYVACSYLFIEPRGRLVHNELSHIAGLIAYLFTCSIIVGIGEAMRAAQRRASQRGELLAVTLSSIGDAVITTDVQGHITSLNLAAEKLTGWSQLEASGQPLAQVFRIVNESTRQPVESPVTRALREGVVVGLANHTILIQKHGGELPIDDSAAPIREENGQISGCVLIFRDVSSQRGQERDKETQLLTAQLLASIVQSSDDAIISKSLDGTIQTWNSAAERLFGYSAAQAVGRHISLVIPPERLAEEDHIIARLKAGQRIDHFDTVRVRSDGQKVLVSLTISPIRDGAGRVVGASKIARDVTSQRQAEEREKGLLAEAADASTKFRAFFDQGALFAGIVDVDGQLIEVNRLACEACGYTREQAIGKPFWSGPWWAPSSHLVERMKAAFEQARAGEIFREELPYFVSNGSERAAEVTILPIKDETGRVLFLAPTGIDITDRKRAESDRQKFVTLAESSTDFIGMCDLNGTPFYVNRAGLELIGLDSIEQASRTLVRDFFFPEDQSRIMEDFFPSVLRRGHGEIDVRFRNFRTGEARWMAYKVLTITDAADRPVALATVSQDVTERRRLEDNLRTLAANLSDADRRKDEFLATLAHELRNPLAPIRNALQILALTADPTEAENARTLMERQLEQMVRLVDDLLDVSRISRGRLELRRESVSLARVLKSAIETSRPWIDRMGHELKLDLPAEDIVVDADLVRLAQVFSNLLNNSSKYMDRGGQIWLTVRREGSNALVSVKDAGIGIAADHLPHIFEMFSQVRGALERSQGGLGIGLSLVKRLVEMHDGQIEAKSAGLSQGAEFVVRLPLKLTVSTAAGAPEDGGAASHKSSHRILIVDDNRDAANSLSMLLQFMGNTTRTAYDGEAGVQAAADFRPAVILLDIGLPKLNGIEACRQIRAQPWGKDIVLIAVTGWGQDEDRRLTFEAGFDQHLVKPVDPKDLMKLLAEFEPLNS